MLVIQAGLAAEQRRNEDRARLQQYRFTVTFAHYKYSIAAGELERGERAAVRPGLFMPASSFISINSTSPPSRSFIFQPLTPRVRPPLSPPHHPHDAAGAHTQVTAWQKHHGLHLVPSAVPTTSSYAA